MAKVFMSSYFPFFFTLLSILLLKDSYCLRSTVLATEEADKYFDLNGLKKRFKPGFVADLYQYCKPVSKV